MYVQIHVEKIVIEEVEIWDQHKINTDLVWNKLFCPLRNFWSNSHYFFQMQLWEKVFTDSVPLHDEPLGVSAANTITPNSSWKQFGLSHQHILTQRSGYNLYGFSDLVGPGWYILCTQEMACTVFLLSVVQEQVKAWPSFLPITCLIMAGWWLWCDWALGWRKSLLI